MWKLVKLTRLIRILKVVKKKNLNLAHKATKALKMDSALERLFFFLFGAFFLIHILSCLWVFFCTFGDDESTFLDESFKEKSVGDQYLTSLYFIITTFSTVGYGDISASNSVEKMLCIIAMLVGVAAFSTGTSAITNLLTNYDQENQKLNKNIEILNKIHKSHELPLEVFEDVKRSIKFQFNHDIEEESQFV